MHIVTRLDVYLPVQVEQLAAAANIAVVVTDHVGDHGSIADHSCAEIDTVNGNGSTQVSHKTLEVGDMGQPSTDDAVSELL